MCGQRWAPRMDPTSGQHDNPADYPAGQPDRRTSSQLASQPTRPDSRQQPEEQLLKITRTSWPATVSSVLSLSRSLLLTTGHWIEDTVPACLSRRELGANHFFLQNISLKNKTEHKELPARETQRKRMPQSRKSPRAYSRDNMKNTRVKY